MTISLIGRRVGQVWRNGEQHLDRDSWACMSFKSRGCVAAGPCVSCGGASIEQYSRSDISCSCRLGVVPSLFCVQKKEVCERGETGKCVDGWPIYLVAAGQGPSTAAHVPVRWCVGAGLDAQQNEAFGKCVEMGSRKHVLKGSVCGCHLCSASMH